MVAASLVVQIDASTESLRRELRRAEGTLSDFSKNTNASLTKIDNSFASFGRAAQGAMGALGLALGGSELLRGFVNMTDAVTTMENRLKSVTGTSEEASKAYELLYRSSQENSVEIRGSVELFARMSRALQGTGADAERVSEMVDTLSKVVRLSGATTAEASGALLQFSQALNSGKLNGEEFRAVAEQLPMLLNAIAQEVANTNGISLEQARAELKKMAEEGTLTTEIIVGATENMRSGVVDAFSEMEDTTANATTRMWNSLTNLVGKIDEVAGVSGIIVSKIDAVTAAFDFGVGASNRYGASLSGLLGWINSIPHPLSLLAQAAAGAAAQVSQAAGEIEAVMKRTAAAQADMNAGLQAWQSKPGEAGRWGGNITTKGRPEELANKMAGGLKVLESTGGRRVSPAITNPMDIAGITGSNVDFTTFGVKAGGVTGVVTDRPKLKFYKGPSKEEKKVSESLQKQADRLKETTRTAEEKFQADVAEYQALRAENLIEPDTYARALEQSRQQLAKSLESGYGGTAKPKAVKPKAGGGGRKATSGGGGRTAEDKELSSLMTEGKSVYEGARTEAEGYRAEIERLDKMLASAAITQETHARAVESVRIKMEEGQSVFVQSRDAASAYLAEISRLQGQLSSGVITQEAYNIAALAAREKYDDARSGAESYAAEIARLDQALSEGRISQEEYAASVAIAQEAQNKAIEEGIAVYEATRTPLERYNAEIERLNSLLAQGVISQDTHGRAMEQAGMKMREEIEEMNASMKALNDLGADMGMTFASAFEEAILAGEGFRDILDGLLKDLQRIVVRNLVTVPLATALTTGMQSMVSGMYGVGAGAGGARGMAAGGWVQGPGSGKSDSILAMLSKGEFIVPASVASRNRDLLESLPKFAAGGWAGGRPANANTPPVQITLENKSSTNLKMEGAKQKPGPDGRMMIRVMVTDAVKEAMGAGEFDRTMGARYGASVQPIVR